MSITKSCFLAIFGFLLILKIEAQNSLKNNQLFINVTNSGIVDSFSYEGKKGKSEISFRSDPFLKGPALFFNEQRLSVEKTGSGDNENLSFSGKTDTLEYALKYRIENNTFIIEASVTNRLNTAINNPIVTLKPGINTELEKYPEWNYIFFPTLLRCEKTHFWGYNMNGVGDVIAIGTKEPVASWQMEYELPGHWRGKGGHLIFSYRLDLMHKLPLPVRHPQDLTILKPQETKSWTFYVKPVNGINEVKSELAKTISAPMIDAEKYTVMENGKVNLTISSTSKATATITNPAGKTKKISLGASVNNKYNISHSLNDGIGVYTLTVKNSNKQIAEAKLTVRRPYSWYLDKARDASVQFEQYAASHLENWLGLHSGFLARKYKENKEVDKQIEDRLNTILSLQWDELTNVPKFIYEMRKVANTAQMISVLVDAYEATGDIKYLEKARGFATIVMTFQYENGDYADYTAIFYPVKSIMELIIAEKDLLDDPLWAKYYEKHYASVKRAIDYLVLKKDNIMTEGQQTFEDGMIGCSATQIAMFALMQKDPELRKHYAGAAAIMAKKHRPLEQLIIPDSRMNGGSIRFWEAQYDVLENKKWNFINSPHGWSAWRLYGTWYLYLLTGDEVYLKDVMNAVGSCVQVIDSETGLLRWAFVADPYCEVSLLRPNPATPGIGEHHETIVGEQYVNMVTDFHYPERPDMVLYGRPRVHGWSCNNDVHEIFKNMEEICLTSAYVIERKDGSLLTWNCKAEIKDGALEVHPSESVVAGVHLNLVNEYNAIVHINGSVEKQVFKGMGWIGKPAFPMEFVIPPDQPARILRD